jgi:hypothetical protein
MRRKRVPSITTVPVRRVRFVVGDVEDNINMAARTDKEAEAMLATYLVGISYVVTGIFVEGAVIVLTNGHPS